MIKLIPNFVCTISSTIISPRDRESPVTSNLSRSSGISAMGLEDWILEGRDGASLHEFQMPFKEGETKGTASSSDEPGFDTFEVKVVGAGECDAVEWL